MNWKSWAWLAGGVGAGMLLYGCFVEAERLVVRRQHLRLPRWPREKNGYRIGLIADFHLRDEHTVELTQRAVQAVLDEDPDVIVIAGDFVGYWKPESPWLIGDALDALRSVAGRVIAVPGNHDYWAGDAAFLEPICGELGIQLLRNESIEHDGILWIGIDSLNARRSDPSALCESTGRQVPAIVVWHEPDAVRFLPDNTFDLMVSGHSHGGQFVFPGGFAPMTTKNGRKYRGGFYLDAPAPLFVTTGIGTTGPPSRFLCPPEAVILTISGV